MTIPVIIDTDPGIDDFFALMVAKACPLLDIRAITAVAGNHNQGVVSKNALDIASCLNIDARVAKGAEKPLVVDLKTGAYIHGDNGLGGAQLPHSEEKFDRLQAWDVIYDEAKKADGKLHMIAIGPLTNVAIALLKHPDLKSMLSGITIMGGSTRWGNVSPYAEFNIYVDPHAAAVVFKSGVTVNMVGLNVTQQCMLSVDEYRKLFAPAQELSGAIDTMLTYLNDSCIHHGLHGAALHDALAVATVFDPSVVEFSNTYVAVEYTSPLSIGQTVVFNNNANAIGKNEKNNSNVAVRVDVAKYKEILSNAASYFAKARSEVKNI